MWVRVAVTFVLLLLPTASHAQEEKRIALLIGNKDYKAGIGAQNGVVVPARAAYSRSPSASRR